MSVLTCQVSATSLRRRAESYIRNQILVVEFNPVAMQLCTSASDSRPLRFTRTEISEQTPALQFDSSISLQKCLRAYVSQTDSEDEEAAEAMGLQLGGIDDESEMAQQLAAIDDAAHQADIHDPSSHPQEGVGSDESDIDCPDEPLADGALTADDEDWELIVQRLANKTIAGALMCYASPTLYICYVLLTMCFFNCARELISNISQFLPVS